MSDLLRQIIRLHKNNQPVGIYAVCSANRYVLEAAMRQAAADETVLLIEATCNQVNQYGGYTGMTPADFAAHLRRMAAARGFPADRLILGGDHLGPNPWRCESSEAAMAKGRVLIRDYVRAGFVKIHLDASMRCGDDAGDPHAPLDPEIVAGRAATLCEAAERAHADCRPEAPAPLYVIGTEVPIPGGATEQLTDLAATTVKDAAATIEITRRAFAGRGLGAAWARVIAVVVQPGVEFGDTGIVDYRRDKALELSRLIEKYDGLVYEAHSTDYQVADALRRLVEDHFAILKVGPWLTFALREALFALAQIEKEWLGGREGVALSGLNDVIERAMQRNPQHWQAHYRGSEREQAYMRKYSYSDRIRYYWPDPLVDAAVNTLSDNLTRHPAPLGLLSQFLPRQHQAVREERIGNVPGELIHHKIREVLSIYSRATGMNG